MQKIVYFFACLALITGSALCWIPEGIKNMIDRGFIANLESKGGLGSMGSNNTIVLKDKYILEVGFMILACLLCLNYYAGCAANKTLARLWVQHNVDIFEKQFHLVSQGSVNFE